MEIVVDRSKKLGDRVSVLHGYQIRDAGLPTGNDRSVPYTLNHYPLPYLRSHARRAVGYQRARVSALHAASDYAQP